MIEVVGEVVLLVTFFTGCAVSFVYGLKLGLSSQRDPGEKPKFNQKLFRVLKPKARISAPTGESSKERKRIKKLELPDFVYKENPNE